MLTLTYGDIFCSVLLIVKRQPPAESAGGFEFKRKAEMLPIERCPHGDSNPGRSLERAAS